MLISDEAAKRLYERAVRLLARREHSRLELKKKLRRDGTRTTEIIELIEGLAKQNLQSDERYTEAYIHNRTQAGYGPWRIRKELQERGISDELIHQYLPQDQEYWQKRMREVWNKKYGRNFENSEITLERQHRFLLQRGFELDIVRKFLVNQHDED